MNSAHAITCAEVKAHLDEKSACLILDVLPPEIYDTVHLPSAKNACVYDVTFVDQVAQLAPDKQTKIILYSSGPRNLASATAAEKLLAAGYGNVCNYQGGLEDWRQMGWPVAGAGAVAEEAGLPDGAYPLDLAASKVEWTGRNFANSHTGTIRLLRGIIRVKDGQVADGACTIDMNSIEDTDLPDAGYRLMLFQHLTSDDFFDTANFPTAEFELLRVTAINEASPGSPNAQIGGMLTLKGISHEIGFSATIASGSDGRLGAEAHFDIDRTRWNVRYGSGKFYEKLGKHLVYDNVTIGLKLFAQLAK